MYAQISTPGFNAVRRDQLRQEHEHDSYKLEHKPAEPAYCPDCGAIYHAGRWQWGVHLPHSLELTCPACHRIHDHFPAGFLHISGEFLAAHLHEIFGLIHHHAERARDEHPLARVMAIKEDDANGENGILITTTDIHLVRDLGEALHRAYHGQLDFHYNEAENRLRVVWRR